MSRRREACRFFNVLFLHLLGLDDVWGVSSPYSSTRARRSFLPSVKSSQPGCSFKALASFFLDLRGRIFPLGCLPFFFFGRGGSSSSSSYSSSSSSEVASVLTPYDFSTPFIAPLPMALPHPDVFLGFLSKSIKSLGLTSFSSSSSKSINLGATGFLVCFRIFFNVFSNIEAFFSRHFSASRRRPRPRLRPHRL